MTSETDRTTEDRIAALEAELARQRAQKAQETVEKAALETALLPAWAPKRASTREREQIDAALRKIRLDALTDADLAYTQQVREAQPRVSRLEAKIQDLDAKIAAEDERHKAASAVLDTERQSLRESVSRLLEPKVTAEKLLQEPERQAAIAEQNERLNAMFSVVGLTSRAQPPPRNRTPVKI